MTTQEMKDDAVLLRSASAPGATRIDRGIAMFAAERAVKNGAIPEDALYTKSLSELADEIEALAVKLRKRDAAQRYSLPRHEYEALVM